MIWRLPVSVLVVALELQASSETEARKLLASRCWACHAQIALGGLRLDSRVGVLRGGKSGAAIVPGDAANSRLYHAITRNQPGVKPMPPEVPLSVDEVRTLERWINEGALWTEPGGGHWSFRPLNPNQPSDNVDSIIDAALKSRGLRANPQADRRVLIRRTYFDLIGLPPDETGFAAALDDQSPD